MKSKLLFLLLFFSLIAKASSRGLEIFKDRYKERLAGASSEVQEIEAHIFYEMGLLQFYEDCKNFERTKKIASLLVDLQLDSSDDKKIKLKKRIADASRIELQKTWAAFDAFVLAGHQFKDELVSIQLQVKLEKELAKIQVVVDSIEENVFVKYKEPQPSRSSCCSCLWSCLFGENKNKKA